MHQDSKRTYTAIVLLIRRLVWRRSRCRRVRGLLKLSIAEQMHGNMNFFFSYKIKKQLLQIKLFCFKIFESNSKAGLYSLSCE